MDFQSIVVYLFIYDEQERGTYYKVCCRLKDKFGIEAEMDLLTKIAIGCGPSIYNPDSSTVSSSDLSELETVKHKFLIKKLGLNDSSE